VASERICMNMGKKTGDSMPVELSEDVWTQCASHGPGNKKGPLVVLNRSIIYRLRPPAGEPFLVVINALHGCPETGEPIAGLRRLEESLGHEIKFVLTPGSGHHLSLADYAKAFPEARVCVPRGRIVRENPELIAMDNVETYGAGVVLPELGEAGLEVLSWEGFVEGPAVKKFQKLAGNKNYTLSTIEPQFFCHKPTGTVTNGGHHMWFAPADGRPVFEGSGLVKFMVRLLTKTDFKYQVPGKLSCNPHGTNLVKDRDAVQRGAQTILAWDFDRMIDIHAALDSQLDSGARRVVEECVAPMASANWAAVVFDDAPASWPN
jgi:hypothetical protein